MSIYDEAIREWVWIVGAERPDECWLLSPHDSWHRNPHYTGPDVPHPEFNWAACCWKDDERSVWADNYKRPASFWDIKAQPECEDWSDDIPF